MPQPEELREEDVRKGMRVELTGGTITSIMTTLTGGVFLVAFALELGASNLMIGFLAAIPALMQLVQLPAAYLVERVRRRRLLTVVGEALSRLFLIILVILPFLGRADIALLLLVLALMMHTGVSALGTVSWNSWMKDLIPVKEFGAFFSRRLALISTTGLILSVIGGLFLDSFTEEYGLVTYSVIFGVALIAGLIGVVYLARIPEPRMVEQESPIPLRRLLITPFRDASFRPLLHYLGALNFAVNLAAPFFTVYLLDQLGFDLLSVIMFQVLTQAVNIAFFNVWGRFTAYYSNKAVLRISTPLFMLGLLGWTFTTLPESHLLTVPLLVVIHILLGISLAGIRLAANNISLKLAPRGSASSYLASATFVNSLAAGIAPIVGGGFADFFKARELSLTFSWSSPEAQFIVDTFSLRHWDFFFFMAFIVAFYSIYRLSTVEEEGTVSKREHYEAFLSEVRSEIRNLSTVAGLRPMVRFPVLLASGVTRGMTKGVKEGTRRIKRTIPRKKGRQKETTLGSRD